MPHAYMCFMSLLSIQNAYLISFLHCVEALTPNGKNRSFSFNELKFQIMNEFNKVRLLDMASHRETLKRCDSMYSNLTKTDDY